MSSKLPAVKNRENFEEDNLPILKCPPFDKSKIEPFILSELSKTQKFVPSKSSSKSKKVVNFLSNRKFKHVPIKKPSEKIEYFSELAMPVIIKKQLSVEKFEVENKNPIVKLSKKDSQSYKESFHKLDLILKRRGGRAVKSANPEKVLAKCLKLAGKVKRVGASLLQDNSCMYPLDYNKLFSPLVPGNPEGPSKLLMEKMELMLDSRYDFDESKREYSEENKKRKIDLKKWEARKKKSAKKTELRNKKIELKKKQDDLKEKLDELSKKRVELENKKLKMVEEKNKKKAEREKRAKQKEMAELERKKARKEEKRRRREKEERRIRKAKEAESAKSDSKSKKKPESEVCTPSCSTSTLPSSSAPVATVSSSNKRKSKSPDLENLLQIAQPSKLPRIPLKSKKEDPLKKSDSGNVPSTSASTSDVQEAAHNSVGKKSSSNSASTLDLIRDKKEEELRKEKERKEEEKRKEQEKKQARIREIERQQRFEEEKKRREIEECRRELIEQEKRQEEQEKAKKKEEEMERLRKNIKDSKQQILDKEESQKQNQIDKNLQAIRMKTKAAAEARRREYEQNLARQSNAVRIEEPPMKQQCFSKPPSRPPSTPCDEFLDESYSGIPIQPYEDNSVAPTFGPDPIVPSRISYPPVLLYFNFDLRIPPKVAKNMPTRAEKKRLFEKYYNYKNFDNAHEEIQKRCESIRAGKILRFEEDGPTIDMRKMLDEVLGNEDVAGDLICVDSWSDDDNSPRNSRSPSQEPIDRDEWTYKDFTIHRLEKKYEWPFEKTNGVYWPVIIPSINTRSNVAEKHVKELLKDHSCSGSYLTNNFLICDDDSNVSAKEQFRKNYANSGDFTRGREEWDRYNAKGNGRFANRKPWKTVATDQTKDDASKVYYANCNKERQEDAELWDELEDDSQHNNEVTESRLISVHVQTSRIDCYSKKSLSRRNHLGGRVQSIPRSWTFDGYNNLSPDIRDNILGHYLNSKCMEYDSLLVDSLNLGHYSKWCWMPMLTSLYSQSKFSYSSNLSIKDTCSFDLRNEKLDTLIKSRNVKLSEFRNLCKLNAADRKVWTILYDNLIAYFDDFPTLSQIMDRPEFSQILDHAFEARSRRKSIGM